MIQDNVHTKTQNFDIDEINENESINSQEHSEDDLQTKFNNFDIDNFDENESIKSEEGSEEGFPTLQDQLKQIETELNGFVDQKIYMMGVSVVQPVFKLYDENVSECNSGPLKQILLQIFQQGNICYSNIGM